MLEKYVKGNCLSGIKHKVGDFQFWMGLLFGEEIFFKYIKKKVGNGENIRFREDWWLDDKPLNQSCLRLYNLCFTKNIKLSDVINSDRDHLKFRRTLWGDILNQLVGVGGWIKDRCSDIYLSGEKDIST